MKVIQSGIFRKKVKKPSHQEKLQLDEVIRKLLINPLIGEEKKGDLQYIYVYKFPLNKKTWLLAYRASELQLELIILGPHENYYRDLKNYLKK